MEEIRTSFLEPIINREASEYIKNNYDEIVRAIPKLGVHEDKAIDLLNDVYISLVEAENEGRGYDLNNAEDGECIMVSQFVYGRLKRYGKNNRYRTDIVESRTSKYRDKQVNVIASSCGSDSDYDSLDSFQRAYAMAGSYDDIDNLEDSLSVRERIEFCIDFEDVVGMNMLELFKNIQVLADVDVNKSLFDPLKQAMRVHDEFAEAFTSVIEFSMINQAAFDEILYTL